MWMQKSAIREQIVKTVVKSGNGGAVWVPKGWLGEEVVIILPEKPKFELKEKIIHLLEPYLKDVVSVAIYGSYARGEQTKESDIDVLAVTRDKNIRIGVKEERIEIVSYPMDILKKLIEKYPAMYYQMVQEAEPLINAYVLEELKSIKVGKESFGPYLKETKEHLKSNRELLGLDKMDNVYLSSHSVVYSAMLRLRGLFITACILRKDSFSNKKFRNWLQRQGLGSKEFEDLYSVYSSIRDSQETKNLKIKITVAEKILNILEKELRSLEAQIHGK